MRSSQNVSAAAKATIEGLARPAEIEGLVPIAARFVFSLRLIAVHERAKRDPVPELANRLGNVEVAARALALAREISHVWPENICVSRFCCGLLTHDEHAIGTIVECACARDPRGFEQAIAGLVRPERIHRLWEPVLGLIAAEMRSAPN